MSFNRHQLVGLIRINQLLLHNQADSDVTGWLAGWLARRRIANRRAQIDQLAREHDVTHLWQDALGEGNGKR